MLILRGFRQAIRSLAFGPDGRDVYWVTPKGEQICVWTPGQERAHGDYRASGRILHFGFSCPRPGSLFVLSMREGLSLEEISLETGGCIDGALIGLRGRWEYHPRLVISADGRMLACSGVFQMGRPIFRRVPVYLKDLTGEEPPAGVVPVMNVPAGALYLALSPDGSHVALNPTNQRTVEIWGTGYQEEMMQIHHGSKSLLLAYSPDGGTLAATDPRGLLKLWDPTTGELQMRIKHDFDNRWVIRGPRDQQRSEVKGVEKVLQALAYSPDGRILATGSSDGVIRFWDPRTGQLCCAYDWEIGGIHALCFSPDGQRACAGGDGDIVVWDVDL